MTQTQHPPDLIAAVERAILGLTAPSGARAALDAVRAWDADQATPHYVAHLRDSDEPTLTACGSLWQGWQQPKADTRNALEPHRQPRPWQDCYALCPGCLRTTQQQAGPIVHARAEYETRPPATGVPACPGTVWANVHGSGRDLPCTLSLGHHGACR